MNTLRACGTLAALLIGGAVLAQQTPQPMPPGQADEKEDRIEPGKTPTRDAPRSPDVDPTPSTSGTEGTAADRTPPGRTPTQVPGSAAEPGTAKIVGTQVVSPQDTALGSVVDVIFDARGQQPEFVVIDSNGELAAVPYSAAASARSGQKLVIDESRLRDAPKVKQGEWRDDSGDWKNDAEQYWKRKGSG